MSGYTKLSSDLVTSTIWREPAATRVVWITMLSLANKHGEVMGSIPGLADLARVTVEECLIALDCFYSPDPYSRSTEFEGRRIEKIDGGWLLLNYDKHRQLFDQEDQKAKAAARQARKRARDRERGEPERDMA